MKPLVTIGVPVYNVEPYIERCLMSVFNQTYDCLELLVIDDCGTDNSISIVEGFQNTHSRGEMIKIIHQPENRGVSEARNVVFDKATGEYIYFLDSDDYIEPDTISCMVNEAVQNQTDVVVASNRCIAADTGLPFDGLKYSERQVISGENAFAELICKDLHMRLSTIWNILYSTAFIRRNQLRFYGRNSEDFLFITEFYPEVKKAVLLPNMFYTYVGRPNSLMGNNYREQIPVGEIRERFSVDDRMTKRCVRLKDRPYYDVYCVRLMKHKFRAVCVALRHRHHFTEWLSDSEIHAEFAYPATLREIFSFKRYRIANFFLWIVCKMPSWLFMKFAYLSGKLLHWI